MHNLTLKALSLITFDIDSDSFGPLPGSMRQDHLINIPIGSKENLQTICNGNYHLKYCKVRKKGLDVKTPLVRCSGLFEL